MALKFYITVVDVFKFNSPEPNETYEIIMIILLLMRVQLNRKTDLSKATHMDNQKRGIWTQFFWVFVKHLATISLRVYAFYSHYLQFKKFFLFALFIPQWSRKKHSREKSYTTSECKNRRTEHAFIQNVYIKREKI